MKKVFAIVLALMLCVSALFVAAAAAAEAPRVTGDKASQLASYLEAGASGLERQAVAEKVPKK